MERDVYGNSHNGAYYWHRIQESGKRREVVSFEDNYRYREDLH